MDRDILKQAVLEGLSSYKIAERLGKSPSTVRYWLKKYSLKTTPLNKVTQNGSQKYCSSCDEVKDLSDFYTLKSGQRIGRLSGWCKICSIGSSKQRQKETKIDAVKYKGGKCQKCNYDKCITALEFHHMDPEKKDPRWKNMKNWSFDKIKPELDKCILLCANCHRESHVSLKNKESLENVDPFNNDNDHSVSDSDDCS